ncbi:MAG: DUF4252 domain-containing protein [Bacteroidales bacterium]|nr:DUF4252 domain-containing protein [Bacteroidales bacterium]
MKRVFLILLSFAFPFAMFPGDFVNRFIEKYSENERPLTNVNIGKTMLDRMTENTNDEELKNAFKELKSIRMVSSEDEEDSRYYYHKAHELVKEAFSEYEEMVSVNESNSKISVFMKRESDEQQDLILITIDNSDGFSLITVSGKIDFDSISKLSKSLKSEAGINSMGFN